MIHVENLTKYYNGFCAVDHINLDIHKGEILGLLGTNGAGKTTTLRMLTGFLKPNSGNIKIKNFNVNDDILEIKKLVGYLPESAPIYQDLLVYDYLNYIANLRGLKKNKKISKIHDIAELCSITNVMHKSVKELSKGYKQRVGLAYAMISDPEILILDEPTYGLDPNQIVEIRNIIRKIGREKTIILSTHILSEAEATCNRIVIINKGKIVADGSTESIKQSLGNEYFLYISLINADFDSVTKAMSSINRIDKIEQIKSVSSNILRVKIICNTSSDIRENLYRIIKHNDWVLMEFTRENKTLENIFRELTKEN